MNKKPVAVNLTGPIKFGHKVSLLDIKASPRILMHGEIIGEATKDIKAGGHVHLQNVASIRAHGDRAKGAAK